jgi:uncharacterized membrane protein YvbJ
MFCNGCGVQVPTDSAFCSRCGKQLFAERSSVSTRSAAHSPQTIGGVLGSAAGGATRSFLRAGPKAWFAVAILLILLGGFDITVWARDENSQELALDSDIFKNTATRVEFLSSVLPKWRRDVCAAGFRQVRLIQGGIFSTGDAYPIGCK